MEKYDQISDEHAHKFNATQEMRQTQELVDKDSGRIYDIRTRQKLAEVPRQLAFIEQHDLATSYVKFHRFKYNFLFRDRQTERPIISYTKKKRL